MPFVSEAQRRKFYSDPRLRKYAVEFKAATPKGAHLPERVHPKKKDSKMATPPPFVTPQRRQMVKRLAGQYSQKRNAKGSGPKLGYQHASIPSSIGINRGNVKIASRNV